MLMPASNNPQKDREIFLKIPTMDADGLWQRRSKSIPVKTLYDWLQLNPIVLTETINARHSGRDEGMTSIRHRRGGVISAGIAEIRTPVRAYYQYGESPYQSKPKPLKLKVTASS
jgi:hypothetical protein